MRGRESLVAEDNRQQRHHRHAAADAEQPRKEADDRTKRHEGDDQRRVHSINGRRFASFSTNAHSTGSTGVIDSRLPRCRTRMCASSGCRATRRADQPQSFRRI